MTAIRTLSSGDDFYKAWEEVGLNDFTIFANGGNDHVEGDELGDFIYGGTGNDVLYGGRLESSGGISGNWGNDFLYGQENDDILIGSDGNDSLDGGTGNDDLRGGGGNDLLIGGDGIDRFDGGAGTDTVVYGLVGTVTVDLLAPMANAGQAAGEAFLRVENILGSNNIDALYGDFSANAFQGLDGADTLYGRVGDDILDGGRGDDLLVGGLGADRLIGGEGNDRASYLEASSMVIADLLFGSTAPQAGEAFGDTFDSIENLFGSIYGDHLGGNNEINFVQGWDGNDRIGGRGGNDILHGMEGDDVLAGDGGSDFLDGGNGSDWAIYDSAPTGVTADLQNTSANAGEAAGDGYASIENLQGSQNGDSLRGDANANSIVGLNGNDLILGRDNNDALYGGEGNDSLDGGNGEDYLEGNAGNDELVGGANRDTMVGGAGDDDYYVDQSDDVIIEAANEGSDDVFSLASFSLQALINVENLTLQGINNLNATGNDASNLLRGNNFSNTLIGLGGADQLFGSGGDDTLDGGLGGDTLNGGDGLDTAVFSGPRSAYTLANFGGGNVRVSGPDGADTLTGIERLQFNDVTVAVPTTLFDPLVFKLAGFGPGAGGWTSEDRYPRDVADVNGDGFGDIVGFGDAGVFVSLGSASGFGSIEHRLAAFGLINGGWSSNDRYPRHLADVNGDGMADIVGFGDAGVFVSLATGGGSFGPSVHRLAGFGAVDGGWFSDDRYHRELADVNGDGMADIVGFGDAGVFVSLATGAGAFGPSTHRLAAFGTINGGWNSQNTYPRHLADVNGDHMADIVGFADAGVYVSLATGGGNFGPVSFGLAGFGRNQSWYSDDRYPREVADVNGDGKADIVGFGDTGVWLALGNGDGSFQPVFADVQAFGQVAGWSSDNVYPRLLADIDHDQVADIVGFGQAGVYASLSSGFHLV